VGAVVVGRPAHRGPRSAARRLVLGRPPSLSRRIAFGLRVPNREPRAIRYRREPRRTVLVAATNWWTSAAV
jgi:hypothetical protein